MYISELFLHWIGRWGIHWRWGKWPTFRSRRHFRMYFLQWKLKYFEKWSKFQHGIRYWLGAFQVTNHCLNQCWHSSSTNIYILVGEYHATLWLYNNRNGDVVGVAALVIIGGAEACLQRRLQRLRWWLGRSFWRHLRFIDKTAMHSYLPLYNILLWIYVSMYSYRRPYKHYL